MRRVMLVCGLALAMAVPAPAVVLRYKLASGEKMVYHDQMAMAFVADGPKGQHARLQFRSDNRVQQTVKSADDGYSMDIETLSSKTLITNDAGKTQKSEEPNPPERVHMSLRGRVTDRKSLGKKPKESGPAMGFTTKLDELDIVQQVFDGLMLPEEDVEPGAKWADTITVDLTRDDKKVRTPVEVKAPALFKRLVLLRGEECAEIETSFEVPLRTPKDDEAKQLKLEIEGTIMGQVTSYFSLKRGRTLVEMATVGVIGKMTATPQPGTKLKVGGRLKFNTKTVLED